MVEDSYKATKYEGLYNDEVVITTTLRGEASTCEKVVASQQHEIDALATSTIALVAKSTQQELDIHRLAKKVNHLKGVVHILEGVGVALLVVALL